MYRITVSIAENRLLGSRPQHLFTAYPSAKFEAEVIAIAQKLQTLYPRASNSLDLSYEITVSTSERVIRDLAWEESDRVEL